MRASLLALALVLVAPLSAPAQPSSTDGDSVEMSYVSVSLKTGKSSHDWPGYDVQHGELTVLEFTQGGVKHVLELDIERPNGGDYEVEYSYARGGTSVASKVKTTLAPKAPLSIKKGGSELVVVIDPRGGTDHSRKDKIDKIHGDDPLDP